MTTVAFRSDNQIVAPILDPSPMPTWIPLLIGLALIPFLLTMVTSFAKFVIVGGLLRQAMGTPQIPPTSVITGLAIILSFQTMSPVIEQAYAAYQAEDGEVNPERLFDVIHDPLLEFLRTNASQEDLAALESMRRPPEASDSAEGDQVATRIQKARHLFTVVAPAFVLTEIGEAFLIGVYLFIPFLIIDLVVSNILLAMGMHMLTPLTISLPIKILLFVCIDGWSLVLGGLIAGYAP